MASVAQNEKNKALQPKKKKNTSTIILICVLILGLGIMLYPTISDYWNSFRSSRVISNYAEVVAKMDGADYERILAEALDYNINLSKNQTFSLTDRQLGIYEEQLNVDGGGVMGYIEIPTIDVTLPICHGTSDRVLQNSVGHINWTSLPVGGESSHCVLSGHRGLPSAKLFTNLDKLSVNDTFIIRILDETLTYEVDQILIVLPDDIENLKIVPGMDYVTLLTCTPYGINTHRLLVRGHRIENEANAANIRVTADATQIEPMIIAPIVAIPILLWLLIHVVLKDKRQKKEMRRALESRKALGLYGLNSDNLKQVKDKKKRKNSRKNKNNSINDTDEEQDSI
ncbi:MAG: class C sortase [Clostridiales bacterium]|nr:class C sortase [Clostridiales bacterium]